MAAAAECAAVLGRMVVLARGAGGLYAGEVRVHESLARGPSAAFPLRGRIVEGAGGPELVPGDRYVILIPFSEIEKLLGGTDGVEIEGAERVAVIPRGGLIAQAAGKGVVVRRRGRECAFMCDGAVYARARLTPAEKELLGGEVAEADLRDAARWVPVDVLGDVDGFYFSVRGVYVSRRLVRRDEAGFFVPLPAGARLVKVRAPLLVPDGEHCVDVSPGPGLGEPIARLENGALLVQYRCQRVVSGLEPDRLRRQ